MENAESNNDDHSKSSDVNESITTQLDTWHSGVENNCRVLVPVDSYYNPSPSPGKPNFPASPENVQFPAPAPVGVNGLDKEEVGGERRSRAAVESILKRRPRTRMERRRNVVELGFRVFEMIGCLVSFSVMAADNTKGWSGDSFHRYKEYRYCLAVNVIGFVYSAFQAFDLSYHLATGKHIVSHHLRYHFDFSMDQILAYILMSASSSAATRVDDWISNWGGDEFTLMASASIAMSFLAFVAFATSCLISGYNLCNRNPT